MSVHPEGNIPETRGECPNVTVVYETQAVAGRQVRCS